MILFRFIIANPNNTTKIIQNLTRNGKGFKLLRYATQPSVLLLRERIRGKKCTVLQMFHGLVQENKKQDLAEMIVSVVFWQSAQIRILSWMNGQTLMRIANTVVLSAARKRNGGVWVATTICALPSNVMRDITLLIMTAMTQWSAKRPAILHFI
jgi:hypothetical protein